MLIVARAPQDAVVAALGPVDADVGPTSAAGLTAVWSSGHAPVRALSGVDLVAVWDEPDAGHVVLHVRHDGDERDLVWPAGEATPPPGEPLPTTADLVAAARTVLGDPTADHPDLTGLRWAHDLTTVLEQTFALPVLDPVRRRAVTLYRGRHADARIVGRLAAGTDGVAVTDVGNRWSVLHVDEPEAQQVVTLAAAAAGSRRSLVLQLWRGDGGAAGFDLVQRDHTVAQVGWDDGWRRPVDEGWESRDEIAAVLAHHVDGDVDLPALRALLRSRSRSGDPLARLVELLGVPASALDVLDRAATAPAADQVAGARWWRVVWEESRAEAEARFPRGIGPRWFQLTVTLAAALLSTVVLLFALAVVVTDGALLDQSGVTVVDWLLLPLAVGGIATGTLGHRQVRRRRLAEVDQEAAPGNPA
ncbi:hypothetical protein [Isoptericola jiangsuensis]|uniref:hypothetical protein n=1 Tax=Isoptericola jiangsuensis TaxID=548579 RepID=UPI001145AD0D|nr:hypothetical protein [Isoptericola jiangsuensis]